MSEYNKTLYIVFKWSHKQWKYKRTFDNIHQAKYYIEQDPHGVYEIEVRQSED